MSNVDEEFAAAYGPWALVVGASDGVGAAFARAMAERGLNVVLLARRQALLDDLAAELRADHGVEARAVALDLVEPDAMERIAAATKGLEVGMVLYCAGGDPNYARFLDAPVEVPLALVQRNTVVPLQVCHHFAGPMVERGRGGIIVVSSAAGLFGGAQMVAYSASKAFDLVMGEALWAELHEQGVDVLSLVLGATDTPSLRRTLAKLGNLSSPEDDTPIPGLATSEGVVAEALEHLADGPTWMVGEQMREGMKLLGSLSRNEAVKIMRDNQANSLMHQNHGATAS